MERRKQLGLGIAALMLGIAPVLMAEPADNAPAQPQSPPPAAVRDEARPQCPMAPQGPRDGAFRRQFGREDGRGRHQRENGLTPKAPMSEDDIAKFADLNAKLRNAVIDFRANGNDQTRAAVKTALDNLVAANQAFEIDRCEKALARAKAKVQEKDELTKRILDRLTAQPKCDEDAAPKAGPAKAPKPDRE